jgi:diguanylate cyclase (GGDEF)-like protein
MDRERYLLGSNPGNDVVIEGSGLAPYHLFLERQAEGWLVRDISGSGGELAGTMMVGATIWQDGQELDAGSVRLVLQGDRRRPGSGVGLVTLSLREVFERASQGGRPGALISVFQHVAEELDSRDPLIKMESQMLRFAIELTGASGGSLAMLDGGVLQRHLSIGDPGPMPNGLADRACVGLVSVMAPVGCAEQYAAHTSSLMVVPLVNDESASAVFYLARDEGGFSEHDLEQATLYANLAAQVLERALLQERLERIAYVDGATGLPNRTRLQELLDEKIRLRLPVALAVVRLDRTELVRNTLGRDFSDRLMREFAEHLRPALRSEETLAVCAEDSLAVLIPDEDFYPPYRERLDAISERVTGSIWVGNKQVYLAANIGVAPLETRHRSGEELIRDAEIAAQRARRVGGSKYCLFEETMHRRLLRIHQVESALRRALANGDQISVAYQPVVRLEDGSLAGFEVLVRWNHPEFGVIEPTEFIPLAEETGLIAGVGRTVMEQSCRQLAAWKSQYPGRPLFLAVNVSPRQLSDPGFGPSLHEALVQFSVSPEDLSLEITESAMIEDPEHSVEILNQIKRLGVRIALDDLGTGYSSFQYLYRLPLDRLKIDQSFVRATRANGDSRQIVRLVTDLGRLLKLELVAEGLELTEDLRAMRDFRCELGQGFLFSQAVSADEASRMVAGTLPWRGLFGAIRREYTLLPI